MAEKKFRSSDARQLKSLLREDTSMFHVPPFQRAYTWKSRNVDELWNSILENSDGYFIGNMVWLENGGDYLIIDGQQRMFTVSLFLIALKNAWISIINNNQSQKQYIFKWIDDIRNDIFFDDISCNPSKEKLRLTPSKENLKKVFEFIATHKTEDIKTLKEIEGKKIDDNQKVFIRNYKHILSLITKELDKAENKIDILKELTTKIQSLYIIPIICASDVDAYKIFEGLNATGVGLSVVDLVKNAVMYSIKDETFKSEVEDLWENLENLFETTSIALFNKFLRHHWISTESYINNSELFNAIKTNKLKDKSAEEVISYTKSLSNAAQLYVGFRSNDKRDYIKEQFLKKELKDYQINEILSLFDNFSFLRNEQVYEVLLSISNKYIHNEEFSFNLYNKFLQNLWTFAFRASVISVNPSDYENEFANLCTYINKLKDKDFNKIIQMQNKLLASMVQGEEIDNNFIRKFQDNDFITYQQNGDNRLINYILRTIVQNDNQSIIISNPTIEHILPLDPSKWNYERSEVAEYVNRIGNLTCLNDKLNKNASNLSIQEKCSKVFNKSEFPINKKIEFYIPIYLKDPIEAINMRAGEYAKIANNLWKMKI